MLHRFFLVLCIVCGALSAHASKSCDKSLSGTEASSASVIDALRGLRPMSDLAKSPGELEQLRKDLDKLAPQFAGLYELLNGVHNGSIEKGQAENVLDQFLENSTPVIDEVHQQAETGDKVFEKRREALRQLIQQVDRAKSWLQQAEIETPEEPEPPQEPEMPELSEQLKETPPAEQNQQQQPPEKQEQQGQNNEPQQQGQNGEPQQQGQNGEPQQQGQNGEPQQQGQNGEPQQQGQNGEPQQQGQNGEPQQQGQNGEPQQQGQSGEPQQQGQNGEPQQQGQNGEPQQQGQNGEPQQQGQSDEPQQQGQSGEPQQQGQNGEPQQQGQNGEPQQQGQSDEPQQQSQNGEPQQQGQNGEPQQQGQNGEPQQQGQSDEPQQQSQNGEPQQQGQSGEPQQQGQNGEPQQQGQNGEPQQQGQNGEPQQQGQNGEPQQQGQNGEPQQQGQNGEPQQQGQNGEPQQQGQNGEPQQGQNGEPQQQGQNGEPQQGQNGEPQQQGQNGEPQQQGQNGEPQQQGQNGEPQQQGQSGQSQQGLAGESQQQGESGQLQQGQNGESQQQGQSGQRVSGEQGHSDKSTKGDENGNGSSTGSGNDLKIAEALSDFFKKMFKEDIFNQEDGKNKFIEDLLNERESDRFDPLSDPKADKQAWSASQRTFDIDDFGKTPSDPLKNPIDSLKPLKDLLAKGNFRGLKEGAFSEILQKTLRKLWVDTLRSYDSSGRFFKRLNAFNELTSALINWRGVDSIAQYSERAKELLSVTSVSSLEYENLEKLSMMVNQQGGGGGGNILKVAKMMSSILTQLNSVASLTPYETQILEASNQIIDAMFDTNSSTQDIGKAFYSQLLGPLAKKKVRERFSKDNEIDYAALGHYFESSDLTDLLAMSQTKHLLDLYFKKSISPQKYVSHTGRKSSLSDADAEIFNADELENWKRFVPDGNPIKMRLKKFLADEINEFGYREPNEFDDPVEPEEKRVTIVLSDISGSMEFDQKFLVRNTLIGAFADAVYKDNMRGRGEHTFYYVPFGEHVRTPEPVRTPQEFNDFFDRSRNFPAGADGDTDITGALVAVLETIKKDQEEGGVLKRANILLITDGVDGSFNLQRIIEARDEVSSHTEVQINGISVGEGNPDIEKLAEGGNKSFKSNDKVTYKHIEKHQFENVLDVGSKLKALREIAPLFSDSLRPPSTRLSQNFQSLIRQLTLGQREGAGDYKNLRKKHRELFATANTSQITGLSLEQLALYRSVAEEMEHLINVLGSSMVKEDRHLLFAYLLEHLEKSGGHAVEFIGGISPDHQEQLEAWLGTRSAN